MVVVAMKQDLEAMEEAAAASSRLMFACPHHPQAAAGKCEHGWNLLPAPPCLAALYSTRGQWHMHVGAPKTVDPHTQPASFRFGLTTPGGSRYQLEDISLSRYEISVDFP